MVAQSKKKLESLTSEIAEHKRVEESLREANRRLEAFLDHSPALVSIFDQNGRYQLVNSATAVVLSRPREEIVGKTFAELLPSDTVAQFMTRVEQLMETRAPTVVEDSILVDGEERIFETALFPLAQRGDEIAAFGSIATDITERKQAEEALRENEARLRAIGDNLPAGLIYQFRVEADGTARFTYVSAAVERLHECTVEEALNDPTLLFDRVVEKDVPAWRSATEKAIREMSLYDHTVRIRRKSGEIRWHRMISRPRRAEGGAVLFDGIDMDITAQKQAEEALWQSKRRLEETLAELRETQELVMQQERMAAVGQLAAGIAHDFNNILASIALYTQMSLSTSELSPTTRQRLQVIAGQADRATELTQQILDFGRQAVIEQRPLAVDSFLKEVVQLLRRTLPERIKIDLSLEAGEHVIYADPARVQQVIVNLALNARDAMPDGGEFHVALSRITDGEINCVECGRIAGGEWEQVEVRDSGTGIPPDVLPHIFEPFFTTRAPLGHGLGLAQVYGIVMQHGGHIEVETEVGQGTAFRLYWPFLAAAQPDAQTAVQPDVHQGEGQTILVVEDDEMMRAALVDVLEMLGYRTLTAADGREALAVCAAHEREISLVLSDWTMPLMSGVELARQLEERHIGVKTLMLTGHPLDEETIRAMPKNIVGWVLKPPGLERLAEAVAQGLSADAESDASA